MGGLKMVTVIYTGVSIAYIIMGIFLLVKRKFIISHIPFHLLNFFVVIFNLFVVFNGNKILGIFIFSIILIVLISLMYQKKYIIFGISYNKVLEILKDILNEEGISYYEEDSSLKLKDYDDKSIFYKRSWDSVEINLKEIRNLTFYKTIKVKLKIKIQGIDEKLFPTNGVFYLISGIGLMMLILFLKYLTTI